MTILDAVKQRALAEFDQMSAETEKAIRKRLRKQGCSHAEINQLIEGCGLGLAKQRAQIAANVAIALMEAGVPLEADANVWN